MRCSQREISQGECRLFNRFAAVPDLVPTRQDHAPEANVRPDYDQQIEQHKHVKLSKSTFHEDRDHVLKVQQRLSEQR